MHVAAPSAAAVASGARATQTVRLASAIIAGYVAVTAAPMLMGAVRSAEWRPLAAHVALLVAILAVARTASPGLRALRDLLPLSTGAFLYVELRWLIPAVGRPHADAVVAGWERLVLPGDPSATWAPAWSSLALSELLHFAYASYYALVLVPPLILYLRGRREGYAATLLALVLVYAICFVTYLVFPVDGPRFLHGPAAAPEGPIRAFVLHLLAAGSSRGTAFPSSHVAASIVASLCALRFQRPVGIVVSLLTLGLTLGTVYGGFHYAVDALAGLIVGVVAWMGAAGVGTATAVRG
jgi:membrane-associated phospholipid phosphatase